MKLKELKEKIARLEAGLTEVKEMAAAAINKDRSEEDMADAIPDRVVVLTIRGRACGSQVSQVEGLNESIGSL